MRRELASQLVGTIVKKVSRDSVEPQIGLNLLFIGFSLFGLSSRKLGEGSTDSEGNFVVPFELYNARRWTNKRLYLYILEPDSNGEGFRSVVRQKISKNGLVGMSYNLRVIYLGPKAGSNSTKVTRLAKKTTSKAKFGAWKRGVDKFLLWLYSKIFAWVIALGLSFPKQERMSHNNGVAGEGKLRIVDDQTFPEHEFFAPGKEFPVRIRHASATFLDDAMNCIRSIAIKFSHEQFDSPFDLQMNTGAQSLFWSAASFMQFAWLRRESWGVEYVKYNRRYPEGLAGAQLAVRRHASSFHNLHYYAKTPFLFVGKDKIKRYAKYRVIPFDNQEETGKWLNPSDWDMSNQRILPDETRGRNFLKNEYEDRIRSHGAKYRLQIQLRTAEEDEDPEIFNNMILWDEKEYPWHDLAYFTIDKIMNWEESTLLGFSVNHMPPSLAALPATSIFDYNSINYMRKNSEIARKARMFSYKVFGMVPPIPDNDNRNVSGFGE